MMTRKHVLDDAENACLLAAWQLGDLLEDLARLAGRLATFAPGGLVAEQLLDTDPQRIGQRGQHFGAWQRVAVLPKVDVGVNDPDALGKLALGETGGEAQGFESVTTWGVFHERQYIHGFKNELRLHS